MMKSYSPVLKCWLTAIICLILIPNKASAQCGTNADFSLGNFTGWTGTWSNGYCNSTFFGMCVCNVPEPFQHPGIFQGPNNGFIMDTAHQYIMTTGFDSIVGGTILPVVFPGGTGKSARLGNASVSTSSSNNDPADAETLSRTFRVTLQNSLFIYYSAIVLADGGHPVGQQPYFRVQGHTSTGDTVPEAAYFVDGTTCHTIGGFAAIPSTPSTYYKPWSADTINLYKYIGKTVTITFITSSCQPQGCAGTHFAYAYLSCGCAKAPEPPVVVSTGVECHGYYFTLTAPAPAISYSWSGPGLIGNAYAQVDTADTLGLYVVRIVLPDSSVVFDSVTVGPGRVYDTAISRSICSIDTFNFYGRKLTTAGVYVDTLTSIYSGCDSIVTLTLAVIPTVNETVSLKASPPVPCNGEAVTFTAVSNIAGASYYFLKNGIAVNPVVTDSVYTVTVHRGDIWQCKLVPGSGCYTSGFVLSNAFTVDSLPTLTITASTAGCTALDTLYATGNFFNSESLLWYYNNSLAVTQAVADSFYLNGAAGTYYAVVKDTNGCVDTSNKVTVFADSAVISITQTAAVCPGGTAVFTALPVYSAASATYQWQLNHVTVGTNSNVFSSSSLSSADTVLCVLSTNALCGSVKSDTSNKIILTADTTVVPAVHLNSSGNFCQGNPIILTATSTNGGTAPVYHWFVNDSMYSTPTTSTFSPNNITSGDSVQVLLISSLPCAVNPAISNELVLHIAPVVITNQLQAICAGGSFNFNGRHLTTTGIYYDTLTSTISGCDSIVKLNLSVNPLDTTYISNYFCQGSSYNFYGTSITTAGVYSKTLISAVTGCDSVVILTLTVNPGSETILNRTICSGQTYNFNGQMVSFAANYFDLLTSTVSGCDSVVELILTVNPISTSSFSQSICAGHSYNFNGRQVSVSGSYYDTLTSTVNGCDSIVKLTLSVGSVVTYHQSYSICPGGTYNFNGRILTAPGTYADTLSSSVSGCDSIITFTLSYIPVFSTYLTQSVCPGQSFNFNGTMLSSAGTYIDTLTSIITGCDSIVTLTLSITPALSVNITQSVCPGHSYNSNGRLLTAAGTYIDTLTSTATGCDSIVTLTLTLTPVVTTTLNQSVCAGHSYNFNGILISIAGTYRDTFTSTLTGCDSVVVLNLQIGNIVTGSISRTICARASYTFGGRALTTSGNYNDTLSSSVSGCDSVVTLSLTVNAVDTTSMYASVCAGSSYTFNGTVLSAGGIYKDTLTSATTGCDSIVTLYLSVNAYPVITRPADTTLCPASTLTLNASAGGALITWGSGYTNGQTVTVNQTTMFSISANDAGCISADTFIATVLPEKVWPGDANEDLTANNYDILYIGIAFGATGGQRPDASLTWQEQCAPAWADSFINGTNFAFADCNGDGIVNYADTEAVSLNYGLIHPRGGGNPLTGTLPLIVKTNAPAYHGGETVTGQVLLATSSIPATGAYGIAYTLDAGQFAKPNSLQVNQAGSWLISAGNQIVFGRNTGSVTTDIAQTRINHTNVPGYGPVASFSFVLDSNFTYGSTDIIATSAALCLNNIGDTIPLGITNDTIDLLVNNITTVAGNQISIYPNPTNGTLIITLNAAVAAAPIAEVYDELGQVILTATLNHNTTALNLAGFARGFYYVKVSSDNAVITTQRICLMK